jgi:hypothetical protein
MEKVEPKEDKTSSKKEPIFAESDFIKEYNEELRKVYHEIDKLSSLLWSHDNTLIRPKRRAAKQTRKSGLYGEESTKDIPLEIPENNWQKNSTAQIGYGEITKGAMQKFFSILQNVDKLFGAEHEPFLKYNKEDYKLTENDTFIDIGSGFGKPVVHAAMQIGWYSKGVEIVPARVEFWIDFVYEYESQNKKRIKEFDEKAKKLEAEKQKLLNTPTKSRLRDREKSNYDWNPLSVDVTDKIDANSSPQNVKEKGKSSFDSFKEFIHIRFRIRK